MPKDASKNIDRYKIRGGQLNEFEYAENQKALAGEKPKSDAKLIPGTPPEEASEGLRPAVKARGSRTTKGTGKAAKSTKESNERNARKSAKVNSRKGATAKKASRKATTKRTARKVTTKWTGRKAAKK